MPAPYVPDPTELDDDEQRFLRLVTPVGLDWVTTRRDFRKRYGARSYRDWRTSIALPPTTALSRTPLTFWMYGETEPEDLPPEYLFAEFIATADARQNHALVEAELVSSLGTPTRHDVSNCLQSRFRFGVFRVEVHTFPPEMQPSAMRRPGANPLLDRNPELRVAAQVSISSEYALVIPDASLASITGPRHVVQLAPAKAWVSRRRLRRNPRALTIAEGTALAWRDEANGRLGISRTNQSLVWDASVRLELLHLRPARGSGGSSLHVVDETGERTTVFDAQSLEPLEPVARELSAVWGCGVDRAAADDD